MRLWRSWMGPCVLARLVLISKLFSHWQRHNGVGPPLVLRVDSSGGRSPKSFIGEQALLTTGLRRAESFGKQGSSYTGSVRFADCLGDECSRVDNCVNVDAGLNAHAV